MGRLDVGILERSESFCDRCLDVVETLAKQDRSRRITDQPTGSATSVGANLFEADESLGRRDFAKCVAIAVKELNETRFWLRLSVRREWVEASRLDPLLDEADQLKRILGAMLSRTRSNAKRL
jgi:four helix bundle protein